MCDERIEKPFAVPLDSNAKKWQFIRYAVTVTVYKLTAVLIDSIPIVPEMLSAKSAFNFDLNCSGLV